MSDVVAGVAENAEEVVAHALKKVERGLREVRFELGRVAAVENEDPGGGLFVVECGAFPVILEAGFEADAGALKDGQNDFSGGRLVPKEVEVSNELIKVQVVENVSYGGGIVGVVALLVGACGFPEDGVVRASKRFQNLLPFFLSALFFRIFLCFWHPGVVPRLKFKLKLKIGLRLSIRLSVLRRGGHTLRRDAFGGLLRRKLRHVVAQSERLAFGGLCGFFGGSDSGLVRDVHRARESDVSAGGLEAALNMAVLCGEEVGEVSARAVRPQKPWFSEPRSSAACLEPVGWLYSPFLPLARSLF